MAITVALFAAAAGCGRRASGRLAVPAKPEPIGWTQTGMASWYGVPYDGRRSSNGEIYDMRKLTAAHRTLPFETWIEVTNLANGRRVDVRITDRGPFKKNRILDLSMAAADHIGMIGPGTARVRLKVIRPPASNTTEAPENSGAAPNSGPSQSVPPQNIPPQNIPPLNIPPQNIPQNAPRNGPAGSSVENENANAAEAPPPVAGDYTVQVGAFSDAARATAFAEGLTFPDTRVVQDGGGAALWRVLVGVRLSKDAAESLAGRIRQTGRQAVVVRQSTVENSEK